MLLLFAATGQHVTETIGEGSTIGPFHECEGYESGREERERAASRAMRAAPALTARKKETVHLGEEEAVCSNAGPRSTSPKCQPTTEPKENNLDRTEHPLYNRYTSLASENHR
jgi:hypothetical protein